MHIMIIIILLLKVKYYFLIFLFVDYFHDDVNQLSEKEKNMGL